MDGFGQPTPLGPGGPGRQRVIAAALRPARFGNEAANGGGDGRVRDVGSGKRACHRPEASQQTAPYSRRTAIALPRPESRSATLGGSHQPFQRSVHRPVLLVVGREVHDHEGFLICESAPHGL